MPALNPVVVGGVNATSTTAQGAYDYTFASLHELAWNPNGTTVNQPEFRQNVYNQYYRLYGDGFRLTTFLYSAGLLLDNWTSSRYTVFEEPNLERTVEIDGVIEESGESEGSAITFNVITGDADYRLIGMSIFIPGEYCNEGASSTPKEFVVTNVTGRAITASPLSSDTVITTDVPDGTLLTVGAAKFGRGQGQPKPLTSKNLQRDFYLTIVGETQEFEGGVNTFQPELGVIDTNGSKTLYAKGLWQMEFLLERAKDKTLWVSEFNTNNVTKTKRDGTTTSNIESFVGLRNHLDDRAQQLPYANSLDPQDLKVVRELYETQGVMADMSFGGFGARLYEGIQDSGFEFLKEYSGGHNLLTNMTGLGANFKVIDMYGHKLVVTELKTFSDRTSFGNPSYRFAEEGFIIPMSTFNVTSDGKKLSLPNIGMGYRKGNNEDRTKMFGVVAGVNGMGFPFVDQFDSTSLYAKCEFGLVALGVNQWINIIAV
jgi:hypothetical protein